MNTDYDLIIIGGGINGAGIARDAAGRGMSVLLAEAQDLAGATSSASTKLIHGGLRYLEYFEFRLVQESLKEREVLLRLAPHIIWPLDFVLPQARGMRPAWMIRAGLYLYDHLGGLERLKKSGPLDLWAHDYGRPLQDKYKKGFRYSDCWVQDSRLVALNALDAAELGAHILTRTACTGLRVENGVWHVELRDSENGDTETKTAAMVVNAAGPWVRQVLDGNNLAVAKRTPHVRLVKGSHIILPRLFDGDQAYILQQPDRRVVFAIPYEGHFTLIGTTESDYASDPAKPVISMEEKIYLCDAINRYFKTGIDPGQVVHSYSGVRPLIDDGRGRASAVTRDYHLEMELSFGAPLLSVFGGKITTYRRLAEEAVGRLLPLWTRVNENPGSQLGWTDTVPLPGGDILNGDFDSFVQEQVDRYHWLSENVVRRYARAYGTRMDRLLSGARGTQSLGRSFGDGIYEAELDYLKRHEWARTAEDILWRRSRLGLHISHTTIENVRDFMGK
ncbi:MAG: glycerol-3-phosphate dehydrogenase [Micavibrio aeruginosavorus]|nr:glycerol-3-phosphate dehydrogenase [Micavibrio aeruginosavorus]